MLKPFIYISFISLAVSCGSNEQKTNNNGPGAASDTLGKIVVEAKKEDTIKPLVTKIDARVKAIEKAGLDNWKYTYTDEYGEKKEAWVYQKENSTFYKLNLLLRLDPLESMDYYYDKEGFICRMDHLQVYKSFWRDELTTSYYFNKGNLFWQRIKHLYKTKNITDTAFSFTEFAADEFPVFHEWSWVEKNIAKGQPENL